MKQYLKLLSDIVHKGVEKESGRANMPNTIGISKGEIVMDLRDGFPLLTTKKMYLKGIILELLWFLRGETNIKYLVDNNVNIWNGDAYRWYQKYCDIVKVEYMSMDEFINKIKLGDLKAECINEDVYKLGDLGKVYGYQWRNQNGIDQVKEVLDGLKSNPYSRYHIIDGWNKADFKEMALPPCHLLYQFIVRPMTLGERENYYISKYNFADDDYPFPNHSDEDVKKKLDEDEIPKFYLDLNMYQRSCDTLLGVPFNIASMSILLMLFAKVSNMLPGVATWIGGDTHLYVNHLPMVEEQLGRKPYKLPELKINAELNSLDDILNLKYEDFQLVDYRCHDAIKAELFTGLKK